MKHFLYLIIIGLAAYSCTAPLYIPNVTNAPTLKEKGDIDISYSYGSNGHDLISTYAPTDEIGLMLNGSYELPNVSIVYGLDYPVKHKYLEGGLGYFDSINKLSVFVGGGIGESGDEKRFSTIDQLFGLKKISGLYNKLFFQSSINLSDNDKVDILLTLRASYITITKLNSDFDYYSQTDYEEYQEFIQKKHNNLFIEPTFTLKTGSEHIKYFLQFGVSKAIFPVRETVFRQRPAILSIGLHSDLNVIK